MDLTKILKNSFISQDYKGWNIFWEELLKGLKLRWKIFYCSFSTQTGMKEKINRDNCTEQKLELHTKTKRKHSGSVRIQYVCPLKLERVCMGWKYKRRRLRLNYHKRIIEKRPFLSLQSMEGVYKKLFGGSVKLVNTDKGSYIFSDCEAWNISPEIRLKRLNVCWRTFYCQFSTRRGMKEKIKRGNYTKWTNQDYNLFPEMQIDKVFSTRRDMEEEIKNCNYIKGTSHNVTFFLKNEK